MLKQTQTSITFPDSETITLLLGPNDEFLHQIEEAFQTHITVRGNTIMLDGPLVEVENITTLISDLVGGIEQGELPTHEGIRRSLAFLQTSEYAPQDLRNDIVLSHKGHAIRPKTPTQKEYLDSIRSNTITFGIGPAGTGKTYLAMATAVNALNQKEVGRLVLTRPVVEAGENLGFLPGTLTEKIDPYIRPLYDALYEMMDSFRMNSLLSDGTIEIAPLAFMRGRTLNDAYIILDEAQNTTPQQMKMFLTRLGVGSKMIITGDITQTDLPKGISGLKTVRQVLEGVEDIAFCEFHERDVVRNSLVSKIVAAYARAEANNLRL